MWSTLDRTALRSASRALSSTAKRLNTAPPLPPAPPPDLADAARAAPPDPADGAVPATLPGAEISRETRAGPSRETLSTPTTDEDIDRMWDRVINRTSEVNALRAPRPSRARAGPGGLLARSTPSPRLGPGAPLSSRRDAPSSRELRLMADLERTLFGLNPAAGGGPGRLGRFERFGLGGTGAFAGGGAAGAGQARYGRRMREEEEDVELGRMEDEIKEDMSLIETDAELLDWARVRVFAPAGQAADGSGAAGAAASPDEPPYPRTYPKILAYLIAVARTHYRNPPLALFFFRHARARSLDSYLAGCLASAYNEYMRTCWQCCRDLAAVEAAAREMQANAVKWDRGTRRVIDDVIESVTRELAQAQRAARGGPGAGDVADAADAAAPTGRWGPDVYAVLARLEGMVLKDVQSEEQRFERVQRQKRDRRRQDWYSARATSGQARPPRESSGWHAAAEPR